MPQTLAGVIYDAQTLAVRRIVIADDDSQLALHIGPGEALTTMPRFVGFPDLTAAIAAVARATGRTPPSMQAVHAADNVSRSVGGRRVF